MTFLRLDVDFPCFSRVWGYSRLIVGLPIPHFLNHVEVTRKFIEKNFPRIETMWHFRPRTAPKRWDLKFGLHSTSPVKFPDEHDWLKKRLGSFDTFSIHGKAPFATGEPWSLKQIEKTEKTFNITCLSRFPHSHVDMDYTVFKWWFRTYGVDGLNHLVFHPCHFYTHRKNLVEALKILEETE